MALVEIRLSWIWTKINKINIIKVIYLNVNLYSDFIQPDEEEWLCDTNTEASRGCHVHGHK